jgi:hypothetical protein
VVASRKQQALGQGVRGPEEDDLDGFEHYDDSAWFAAIRAADTWRDATAPGPKKSGDLSSLVNLLRVKLMDAHGAVTMTREECELLIDLLSRHRLKQKPGGRKVPTYKRSSRAELRLEIALETVRYFQSKGMKADDAVERTAREGNYQAAALRRYKRNQMHPERRRARKPA